MRGAEAQRRRLDVDDPEVASDFDTPSDLPTRCPGLAPEFAAPVRLTAALAPLAPRGQ